MAGKGLGVKNFVAQRILAEKNLKLKFQEKSCIEVGMKHEGPLGLNKPKTFSY
jgi:hypothetical protein